MEAHDLNRLIDARRLYVATTAGPLAHGVLMRDKIVDEKGQV